MLLKRESATMSHKRAHRFLTTWRSEKSLPAASQGAGGPAASQGSAGGPAASQATAQGLVPFSMEREDLTNSSDFDWRAYVAHREPDLLAMLFDEKTIESFEIRFCKSIDRNCNQHRCDFVAHRSDGMIIRFHPSQKIDAKPTIGELEDIEIGSTSDFRGRPVLGHLPALPAASQGHVGPGAPSRGVYAAVSQHDVMNKTEGLAFLRRKQNEAEAAQWNSQFWEDLTNLQEKFAWPLLVAGLDGGRKVLQGGVSMFAVVWVGKGWKQTAFYLRQDCGSEWVLFLRTKKVWNQEAVADIDWI